MIAIMTTVGVLLLIDKEWIGLFLLVMGGILAFVLVENIVSAIKEYRKEGEILIEQKKRINESFDRLNDDLYLSALAMHDKKAKEYLEQKNASAKTQNANESYCHK